MNLKLLAALSVVSICSHAHSADESSARAKIRPILEPARAQFSFQGPMGERLKANTRNWLLVAPRANPAMLQIFRDRDRTPRRDLVPWAGEFAGKYLISATQAWQLTRDPQLEKHLHSFVAELVATQDSDGYFGPFPKDARMTGPGLWDLWGQYHVMLGLYGWSEAAGDAAALAACRRCADYFCQMFLDGGKRVVQAGSEEMNESSIHIFTLLYRKTGEDRYLRLAREIERDWQTPPSGDYLRAALDGKAFFQMAKPRWESLHGLEAIAELHFITGEDQYRRALDQIWWSILEGDRHTTGGFSSGEQATGNPYDPRPIETCCTIAWMALTIDYLRMTGDSRAADELELSTWNGVLGAQNPDGRWWTYNTPMDGERKASAHEIVFQARAGSPELNCCSVNGPRGLGMLSRWAIMTEADEKGDGNNIVLNYWGPSGFAVVTPAAGSVQLVQQTDYPVGDTVQLRVTPEREAKFALKLRLPGWSRTIAIALNGVALPAARAGSYLALDRTWKPDDKIDLKFDFAPRVWVGEREAAGKAALYRGPLLLAYDPRFDTLDHRQLPAIDPASAALVPKEKWPAAALNDPQPLVLVRVKTADGRELVLCDFATAGAAGNPYVSWLPCPDLKPVEFTRDNPLRAVWP